jgi:hypothetical protein
MGKKVLYLPFLLPMSTFGFFKIRGMLLLHVQIASPTAYTATSLCLGSRLSDKLPYVRTRRQRTCVTRILMGRRSSPLFLVSHGETTVEKDIRPHIPVRTKDGNVTKGENHQKSSQHFHLYKFLFAR